MGCAVGRSTIDLADYLDLAEIVACKFCKNKNEIIKDTEQYSTALLELVKAHKEYDPSVNDDFRRFAYRFMDNGLKDRFRYNQRKKRKAVLEHLEQQDVAEPQKEDYKSIVETILSKSPQDTEQDLEDKIILRKIYLEGQKVTQLAEEYKVSRITIYNRINNCIRKIKFLYPDFALQNN